jgi:hypothetical protein
LFVQPGRTIFTPPFFDWVVLQYNVACLMPTLAF